jgi:hypothetical protein
MLIIGWKLGDETRKLGGNSGELGDRRDVYYFSEPQPSYTQNLAPLSRRFHSTYFPAALPRLLSPSSHP